MKYFESVMNYSYDELLDMFNERYKCKFRRAYDRMEVLRTKYADAINLNESQLKERIKFLEGDLKEIGEKDCASKWLYGIVRNTLDNHEWCLTNYIDNHSTYKILGISNGDMDGNTLLNAHYEVLKETDKFEITCDSFENFLKENAGKCNDFDFIATVKFYGEEPLSCGLYGCVNEDDEPYVDVCEWDNRVSISVALGRNLM